MDYKDSIVCQKVPKLDNYIERCSDLLRRNNWSELALNLSQCITDYKNDKSDLSDFEITLEIFFILESSILKIANTPILKFASTINSFKYSEFLHLYILNEYTHAKFYRDLYVKMVAHNKVIDDNHVKELYEKYQQIDCFMKRVIEIEDNIDKDMNWMDFLNLSNTEGIKFMSGFHNIFYYARNGKYLVVVEGNRWVSIDEFIHSFSHLCTSYYLAKLIGMSDEEFILSVIQNCEIHVNDEKEFSQRMYKNINMDNMFEYIEWLGQKIIRNACEIIGIPEIIYYPNAKLPSYMKNLVLENKELLHETVNTNYVKIDNLSTDISGLYI